MISNCISVFCLASISISSGYRGVWGRTELYRRVWIGMYKIFGKIFVDRLINSAQCFRTFCDLTQLIMDLDMLPQIPKRHSLRPVVVGHIVIPVYFSGSPSIIAVQ